MEGKKYERRVYVVMTRRGKERARRREKGSHTD
jgi:hypothetical protein